MGSEAKFCDTGKLGVFCDAVTHSTEKRTDGEVKVVQLSLRVQPFDAKIATAIDNRIRTTLFKLNHPDPHAHIRRGDFIIDLPRQILTVFASPDTVKASIALDQVKIAGIYARTDGKVSGYALVFKASFGPPSARELEYVEDWRNGQRFVTFEEAAYNPELAETDDEAETADDGQASLLQEGTCLHGARVGQSCGECAGGQALAAPLAPPADKAGPRRVRGHGKGTASRAH